MKCRCPQCQTVYSVPPEQAGKKLRCSTCQNVFKASPLTALPKRLTPPEEEVDSSPHALDHPQMIEQDVQDLFRQLLHVPTVADPPQMIEKKQLLHPRSAVFYRVMMSALLILLGLGMGWVLFGSKGSRIDGLLGDISAKSAIRKYLKANLNDPDFEEIKWWPSDPLEKSLVYTYPDNDDNLRMWDNWWKPIIKPGISVRLKYRAKNPLGARIIFDQVFLLDQDGRVLVRMAPENLRPNGESLDDYETRMISEPSTQAAIGSALKPIQDQKDMQGFLQGIKDSDPIAGERDPLKP